MPKIVDHDKRREEISEALWRVLAREGIEGVSIRNIAAEVGQSRGVIEHYFDSKEELVRHACRLAIARTLTKVRERHASVAGREALRGVLLDDLGVAERPEESMNLWFGLLSAAARDPLLGAEFACFDEEMRAVIAEMLTEMISRGEAPADLDPQETARSLFGFNLGMATEQRLRPAESPEAMEAQVDAFLDGISRGGRPQPVGPPAPDAS